MTSEEHTVEERLRAALAAQAATVRPAPDTWVRLQERIRRRQRRAVPALAAAVAVAAAVVLGVGALTAVGPGDQEVLTRPPAPATPPPDGGEEGGPAPTTPTSKAAPLPETFLAVRDHATELVVVETATGRVRRTLVDLGDYPVDGTEEDRMFHGVIDGLALGSDGRTVYYSTGPEPAVGNLHRIGIDGRDPVDLGDGLGPATSPDGRRLAYVNLSAVVVAGPGRVPVRIDDPEGDTHPRELAWSPDSRRIAFVTHIPDDTGIRVLDAPPAGPDDPGPVSLDDARLLPGSAGRRFLSLDYRVSDGLLGVLEACCALDPERPPRARVFAVLDPDTGAEVGRLDLPFEAVRAVYDASGRHQLVVAADGSVRHRSGGAFTTVPGLAGVSLVAW